MVVGKKHESLNVRPENEKNGQTNSYKCLGSIVTEVIRKRIAVAKELFDRKRKWFCGSFI